MNVTEYAVIVRLYTGGQVLCIIGYLCMHVVYMYIHIHMYVQCSSFNLPLTCGHVTLTFDFTAMYVFNVSYIRT